jgi:hypothetical protein
MVTPIQPGAGRVGVLLVVGSQEPLVESALAVRENRAPRRDIREAEAKIKAQIDPAFPAVPLGSGLVSEMSVELTEPAISRKFAVRAIIEAKDLASVPEKVGDDEVFSDTLIEPFQTCAGDPPVGGVADVQNRLGATKLALNGLDGNHVAIAIMDTGINLAHLGNQLGNWPRFDAANSWTPPGVGTLPGQHQLGHGTMCAFDALIMAPDATLLDYPVLRSPAPGGAASSGTIGVALVAYAQLMANFAVAFAPGGAAKYNALVVSNSWGLYHPSADFPAGHRGRYIDNPNHPFHLVVTALARSGADIVFAAGNCGSQCPSPFCQTRTVGTIMGANAHPDVLTLAGCDTNDDRVGYSSQGPSIANMPPQKPDVTAYTHFLGSEALGAGSPDGGTSTACPVAAGCIAAIRTKVSPFSTTPSGLIAQIHTMARKKPGQVGWNADYGHGIIDPAALGSSLGLIAKAVSTTV